MDVPRLTEQALAKALEQLDSRWQLEPADDLRFQCLHTQLNFRSFGQAFAFMTQVALLAEKLDHHPDWHNVYSRVDVWLSTHDAGGLTTKDFEMAQRIDQILADTH